MHEFQVGLECAPPRALLYHYTGADKLAKILHSRCLRFGSFESLNDPRETKEISLQISESDGNAPADYEKVQKSMNRYMRRSRYLACFTLEEFAPQTGFGEWNRGYARARSWAQYGGNHAGACLVFDREALVACTQAWAAGEGLSSENVREGLIRYVNRGVHSTEGDSHLWVRWAPNLGDKGVRQCASRLVDESFEFIFLEKNSDWEAEREYRIIVDTGRFDDEAVLVPAVSSLVGIVLGEWYPPEEQSVLRARLRLAGIGDQVNIGRLLWLNGIPSAGVWQG